MEGTYIQRKYNEEDCLMDTEMVKVKRGNMLSNLWEDIFKKKLDYVKTRPLIQGYLGQHTNPARQAKNKIMREEGLTGKQYRKRMKSLRRTV
jgi:hypothetical protein